MKVVWSRRAIQHLVALRKYIEKDSEQNAAFVAKRILQSIEILQTQPDMGRPGRVLGTRELVIPDTRYIVPYRVRGDWVEILRAFHTSRRLPRRW